MFLPHQKCVILFCFTQAKNSADHFRLHSIYNQFDHIWGILIDKRKTLGLDFGGKQVTDVIQEYSYLFHRCIIHH